MNRRLERLERQIKKEVSFIIRDRLRDPRIGFVTITDVNLSIDFKYAKVYVSVLGEEKNIKVTMKILKDATGAVRKELGKRLRVRFLPAIQFKYDSSIEYSSHIDSLLKKIDIEKGKERDEPGN